MLTRLKNAIEAGKLAVADADGTVNVQSVHALLILNEMGPLADQVRVRFLTGAQNAGHRAILILGPDSELEHPDLSQVCEFLPRVEDLAKIAGRRPAAIERYRLNRLRLILSKWGVNECRWIGDDAADLVEAWNSSAEPVARPVTFLPAA